MNEWWPYLIWIGAALVSIGSLVLYVWTLVNAAKNDKWVWFVLILLVWPLFLAYLLFADKHRPPPQKPTSFRREPT